MNWPSDRTLYAAWAAGALASAVLLWTTAVPNALSTNPTSPLIFPSDVALRGDSRVLDAKGSASPSTARRGAPMLVTNDRSDHTGADAPYRLPSVLVAPGNLASGSTGDSSGGSNDGRKDSSQRSWPPVALGPPAMENDDRLPLPPAPIWTPENPVAESPTSRPAWSHSSPNSFPPDDKRCSPGEALAVGQSPRKLPPVSAEGAETQPSEAGSDVASSEDGAPSGSSHKDFPFEQVTPSQMAHQPARAWQSPAPSSEPTLAPPIDANPLSMNPLLFIEPPPGPRGDRRLSGAWTGAAEDLDAAPLTDAGFQPWWQAIITQSLDPAAEGRVVDPHGLLFSAMQNSPRIEAVRALPAETQAAITEAEAAFDLTNFLEASFLDLNDPVGNDLVTGGPPRLHETTTRWRAGMRKLLQTGGALEFSQGTSMQDSNSLFFNPQDQGQTRLAVSFSQPLLRGAGHEYNQRQIVLAEIRNEAACQEYYAELQTQLAAVSRAYWDLYLRRSLLAQHQRHYESAVEVLDLMQRRQGFDAAGSQLARARAAVASRQVAITRSLRDVRNAETEVRRLVQDPLLMQSGGAELITSIAPSRDPAATDVEASVATAIQNRPEVLFKLRELRAACVEQNISRKDLLPSLNLVVSSYVTGLRGDYNLTDAWAAQFSQGSPTYGAGLVYEAPWGRRAAHARFDRAQARLARKQGELRAALADVAAQVEVAVHDVAAAHLAMKGRLTAMQASQQDIEALRRQWEIAPGDGRLATVLLDELLDAQQRLLEEEKNFAVAENEYITAQVALLRAEGRLMTMMPE